MAFIFRQTALGMALALSFVLTLAGAAGAAAERERVETFLEVTGFDVALESIRLSADSAPAMLGLAADDFGSEWSRLVEEVFATSVMHEMGLEILEKTLPEELLEHGIAFYGSELGQRLVAAENDAHMEEEEGFKAEAGGAILEGLRGMDSDRVAILERLNAASAVEDTSIAAMQEVQIRFLLAAAAAGVIELRMEEPDLREAMRSEREALREGLRESTLEGAAYTYQAFTDEELITYAEALEDPKMQQVYELMNAVQYEIMANRFEAVAERLSDMQPSQDL
jgi:Uncharacterized protein conserved in bacteria (DUF2059)